MCFMWEFFTEAGSLKRHIRVIHENNPKNNKCDTCGKLFATAVYHLKKHIKVHDRIKVFKCDTCGKLLSTRGSLKTHILRAHSGLKPNNCDMCEKTFTQAGNLKKHIYTIHEGNKDFQCFTCDLSFSQLPALKNHISVHHQKNKSHKNKCNCCGKSFSDLKTHIWIKITNVRYVKKRFGIQVT